MKLIVSTIALGFLCWGSYWFGGSRGMTEQAAIDYIVDGSMDLKAVKSLESNDYLNVKEILNKGLEANYYALVGLEKRVPEKYKERHRKFMEEVKRYKNF